MKSLAVVATFCLSLSSFAQTDCRVIVTEATTNVSVCVGAQWPSNSLADVSARDSSTPETVFLGVVRALNTANLRDRYFHFETNKGSRK